MKQPVALRLRCFLHGRHSARERERATLLYSSCIINIIFMNGSVVLNSLTLGEIPHDEKHDTRFQVELARFNVRFTQMKKRNLNENHTAKYL